ncbi:MAG TPA: hypothetical protein VK724_18235, partial [Bryobacteraceae bacterium]|nr:hypothetical protein [Bryobacteraceae bacterium]
MSGRRRLVSIALTAVSSLGISIYLVYGYDTEPLGGYVASFSIVVVGAIVALLLLVGVGLLIRRRTRWAGKLTVACALPIPFLFIAGIRVSESWGWITWDKPRVEIAGPKVRGEIVYYKPGVTEAQMESFEQSVLYEPQPDGRGSDFIPGVTHFRRLRPSQADGHDGFAIAIDPGMSITAREELTT